MWTVIVNNVSIEKIDAVHKLDYEEFEVFREAWNRNQQKRTMRMKALEFYLMGDVSKTDDQMLRLAAVLQTIEYSSNASRKIQTSTQLALI